MLKAALKPTPLSPVFPESRFGPLGVSLSNADSGDAMTPLATQDSDPQGGHWVWPSKACEWHTPPTQSPKPDTCESRPTSCPAAPAAGGRPPTHLHHLSVATGLGWTPITHLPTQPSPFRLSLLPSFLYSVVKARDHLPLLLRILLQHLNSRKCGVRGSLKSRPTYLNLCIPRAAHPTPLPYAVLFLLLHMLFPPCTSPATGPRSPEVRVNAPPHPTPQPPGCLWVLPDPSAVSDHLSVFAVCFRQTRLKGLSCDLFFSVHVPCGLVFCLSAQHTSGLCFRDTCGFRSEFFGMGCQSPSNHLPVIELSQRPHHGASEIPGAKASFFTPFAFLELPLAFFGEGRELDISYAPGFSSLDMRFSVSLSFS